MRIFISQKPTIRRICRLDHFAAISILAGTRKRNVLASCLIVLAFALTAQQGHACTLNVTGVNFGSYDVFSNTALDSTGNIDVNCPSGIGYSVALSAGGGTHTQRLMSSGANTLSYNLFTAANRAVVWGDSTRGTVTVNGTGIGVSVNHGVYGRIPALQNAHIGSYSDFITVELTF
ncbi:spore coat U domain-containing protein [Hellea sp.]|nr:spore coat U domain-containing protein [Hellea sp.]MDA8889037.1 spore coat U domain-containing protein [Hellea sp.]MDA9048159.1 spore coat U domain-containing protein [Hellea sp.]MDB4844082.1 spore coat U domain-containing protein [Hellea sp.]MDC0422457.1 spore coat U domain-containing protein [Hellea sp.]MDC1061931.1 spore coat U domain-containing protein [Hellea sp.]